MSGFVASSLRLLVDVELCLCCCAGGASGGGLVAGCPPPLSSLLSPTKNLLFNVCNGSSWFFAFGCFGFSPLPPQFSFRNGSAGSAASQAIAEEQQQPAASSQSPEPAREPERQLVLQ
jgi:hypothetical protein